MVGCTQSLTNLENPWVLTLSSLHHRECLPHHLNLPRQILDRFEEHVRKSLPILICHWILLLYVHHRILLFCVHHRLLLFCVHHPSTVSLSVGVLQPTLNIYVFPTSVTDVGLLPWRYRLLTPQAEPNLCFDTTVISFIKGIPQTQANSNQRWTRRAFTRYVASEKRTRFGGYLALSRLCLRV